MKSGATLRFETCKEEWVSPIGSARGNETITYETSSKSKTN